MGNLHRIRTGLIGAVAAGSLCVAACGEREPEQEMPSTNVLEEVWVFPLSVLVSYSGTGEALQTTFASGRSPDTVAVWYRRTLDLQGWDIVGDARSPEGEVTIHAVRDGPPLWIIIRDRKDPPGTIYTLIGAQPDTTEVER